MQAEVSQTKISAKWIYISTVKITLQELFPDRVSNVGKIERDLPSITKKRIAIIGGAGSIGSQILIRLIEQGSINVEIWDSDESRMHTLFLSLHPKSQKYVSYRLVDVRNNKSVYNAFSSFRPQILVHAAALKHVSVLEEQPFEAFLTNVIGTENIARNADAFGTERALFISSDKAANPKSILGKTKLIGERIWSTYSLNNSTKTHWAVTRFGNVFLSRGSVVETFISQIENGLPITITHPHMSRYFMDLADAANLICYILEKEISGISILKMGEPIFIEELARRLFLLFKKEPKIKYIGIKNGEKLSEELFSEEEFSLVDDRGAFLNCPLINEFSLENLLVAQVTDNIDAKGIIDQLLESKS